MSLDAGAGHPVALRASVSGETTPADGDACGDSRGADGEGPCAVLESLTLRGFRSFRNESVSFENPVFLVGANGAGKTNLTEAFAFLAGAMQSPLPAVVESRGGFRALAHRGSAKARPGEIGLGVVLREPDAEIRRVGYEIALRPGRSTGDFEVARERCAVEGRDGSSAEFERTRSRRGSERWRSSVAGLAPAMVPDHLALPIVAGDPRFRAAPAFLASMRVYRVTPPALRALQEPQTGKRLRADGGNAASVLEEIQRTAEMDGQVMRNLVESVVPGTVDLRARRVGQKRTMEFREKRGPGYVWTPASSMSDGALRLVALLLAVFQPSRPSVLVLEEPETTMPPGAVGAVLDILGHARRFMQVVVTTHSPEMLDAKWIEDRHLRLVESEDGRSRVRFVSPSARGILRDRLASAGELFRSNALHSDDGPAPDPPSFVVAGAR